ncbi:hypothetical protein TNCV_2940301 [Trichonephila clavipes]|nr:hypothetical protein TNCV_2940301 [Trichonephila clavipes]
MRQIERGFSAGFKSCGTLNFPRLSKAAYITHENKLMAVISEVSELSMQKAAAELFTYIPLEIKEDRILKYNIPSNPARFLLQIQNSVLEYCSSSDETAKTASHPTLTEEQLINRAVVAFQELKAVLLSRLIDFFLFEDSLTGVTSPSPVRLKTSRVEKRCTLNLPRAQTSSCWSGVVVKRPAQVSSSSTIVQNYEVVAKSPRVAEQCDVNINSLDHESSLKLQ